MPEESNSTATDQQRIKCPNCGANMFFSIVDQANYCKNCETTQGIKKVEIEIKKYDFNEHLEMHKYEIIFEDKEFIECVDCGAAVEINSNIISSQCSFCTSPLKKNTGSIKRNIKPESILPFIVNKTQAEIIFNKWMKRRRYAPLDFLKKFKNPDQLTGIYIPYWSFDAKSSTYYKGTRVVKEEKKEKRYEAFGYVDTNFFDYPVVASKSLPKKIVDRLDPWDTENLVPFDSSYLSGFSAECYQLDLRAGFENVKLKMEIKINDLVKKDIGGKKPEVDSLETTFSKITFRHSLFPIWMSAYKYKEKIYPFVINGRTGEIHGEHPYSIGKITFAILGFLSILFVAIYFFIVSDISDKIIVLIGGIVFLSIYTFFMKKDVEFYSEHKSKMKSKIK